MPRTIECELTEDLVDMCIPGDEVRFESSAFGFTFIDSFDQLLSVTETFPAHLHGMEARICSVCFRFVDALDALEFITETCLVGPFCVALKCGSTAIGSALYNFNTPVHLTDHMMNPSR